jgi:hypothetical protein
MLANVDAMRGRHLPKVGFQACMAARGWECNGDARSDSAQTKGPEHPNVATPQSDVDALRSLPSAQSPEETGRWTHGPQR